MDNILGVLGGAPEQSSRNDDDFSDRLNYRYTSLIMVVFAMVVSTKQFVGDPINCWVPAHFTDNHEDYANNYCWVKSTYYLPFEEYIPKEHEDRFVIPYYQWVPVILLVQGLLFYLPCLFWRSMNARSGIDVNNVVESAEVLHDTQKSEEEQKKTLERIVKQTKRYLRISYKFHNRKKPQY